MRRHNISLQRTSARRVAPGVAAELRFVRRHGTYMRWLALVALLFVTGCAGGSARSCSTLEGANELLERQALVEVVDYRGALERLLAEGRRLEPEQKAALVKWFDQEWAYFTAGLPADAKLWWFKQSKGAMGYRRGVVALNGCRVLRSDTMIEDN